MKYDGTEASHPRFKSIAEVLIVPVAIGSTIVWILLLVEIVKAFVRAIMFVM